MSKTERNRGDIGIAMNPPNAVVGVPMSVAGIDPRYEYTRYYTMDKSTIQSIVWYIDNEEVQRYDKPKQSGGIMNKLFSSKEKEPSDQDLATQVFTPTLEHLNKTVKMVVSFTKHSNYQVLNHPGKVNPTTMLAEYEFQSSITKYTKRTMYQFNNNNNNNNNNGNPLSIISYNIMADIFTQPNRYDCPTYALYRPYRQYILPEYIVEHQGDIVCLQEYECVFKRMREVLCTNGIYYHTPLLDEQDPQEEQCITFYDRNKFEMIEEHLIVYNNILKTSYLTKDQIEALQGNHLTNLLFQSSMKQHHHNRHVFVLLKDIKTGQLFIVLNVHLFWGSTMEWNYLLQVTQMYLLTLILSNFIKTYQEKTNAKDQSIHSIPIIICGDFNNDNTHYTYQFLRDQRVTVQHGEHSYEFTHQFNFTSSYSKLPNGEPPFTTKTKYYQGTIDQIWMSTNSFKVNSVLEIGDHWVSLPSIVDASDHILLNSILEFTQNNQNNNNN